MDDTPRTKRDTTGRGDISEMEIATALMRAGHKVPRPISTGFRYDLVIDHVVSIGLLGEREARPRLTHPPPSARRAGSP